MKSLAIAFGVRFFRVMISVGGAFMDNLTGNVFTRSQLAPKCNVEPGRKVRNCPISTKRVRTAVELDTTCGVGGVMPAARNPSAINALATLSNSGMAQGSPRRSLRSTLRRRDKGLLRPAITNRGSSNKASDSKSSLYIELDVRKMARSIRRSRSILHKVAGSLSMTWNSIRGCRSASCEMTAGMSPSMNGPAPPIRNSPTVGSDRNAISCIPRRRSSNTAVPQSSNARP